MTRINTNVPSLVAGRVVGNNSDAMNKALERLSTGLRINRGKDDPAGLIASETLRSEMTAIGAAMDNARRADNVISIAEGGLQEVSSLLISLENLVDRTANEAGLSEEEVEANQLQIDSILQSLNRIATSTEFQGRKLLNGNLDYNISGLVPGPTASSVSYLQINSARVPNGGSRSVVVDVTASAETAQLVYGGGALASSTSIQVAGQYGTEQLSFAAGATVNDIATAVNGSTTLTGVSATASGGNVYFNSTDYGSDAFVTVEALAGSFSVTGGDTAVTDYGVDVGVNVNGVQAVSDGLDISVRTNAFSADMTLTSSFATDTSSVKTFYVTGGGADFSIAPTVGINSLASLGIPDVSTGSLGKASVGFLQSIGTGGANEMDSGNFETAQRIVREASKQVSTLRGRLGAFQKDTLSTMINSLEVAMENTTAAESAIRDADFAKETSSLTRAQILVNSSMSTLQLANAAPRNVLSLIG